MIRNILSLLLILVLVAPTWAAVERSPGGGGANQEEVAAEEAAEAPTHVAEEIVVTAPYSASEAVTGTKTDTPLLEVPQSIGVVSRAVLEERRPVSLLDALYNVSGVSDVGERRAFDNLVIRGFTASPSIYLDGLRVERGNWVVQQEPFGLERVEVLKGPGSVLFGQGSLGAIVHQVSKQPGTANRTAVEIGGGRFGTRHGAIDVERVLGAEAGVSARLNALYRDLGDSIDANDKERVYVSPSVRWASSATTLTFLANYTRDRHEASYVGVPAEGVFLPNANGRLDRRLYIGEPDNDLVEIDRYQVGYQLEHRVGEAWRLRQNARYSDTDVLSTATFSNGLAADQRNLARGTAIFDQTEQSVALDTHLERRLGAGRVENTLLFGLDVYHQDVDNRFSIGSFPDLDLFAPVYGGERGPVFGVLDFRRDDRLYGLYAQNQMTVGERWSLLLGGRYDLSRVDCFDRLSELSRDQNDSDLTWRAGAGFRVVPDVAVYASYAEAFNPNFGVDAFGTDFDPELGRQLEAGVKADANDGRVRGTLAFYQLTRDNVLVPFPDFPGTQVQTGQQRSRGVEADLAVELRRGWNLTAAYAHTDVRVRRDTNPLLVGDRPANVPRDQLSLWTSRYFQLGGGALSPGLGGRYVRGREGTLPNSYQLPDYVVVDAAVAYRVGPWWLQINAYNLLDREYVSAASPTGVATVLLGEPRTVRAALGYAF